MTHRLTLFWVFALFILGQFACGNSDDTQPPSLNISPTTLEFGDVPVNADDYELTFVLSNSGGGLIQIESVTLVEGKPGVWGITRDGTSTLGEGESTAVSVWFTPDDLTDYTARIQVRSSDAGGSQYILLLGAGAPSDVDSDGDGYSALTGDCDDGDATRSPGNAEVCDGKDNNCDGIVPQNESDADYDGYRLCSPDGGDVDCDDGNAEVYPGAKEICDDKDNNCDGINNDRNDQDGDGASICDDDCNDSDATVAPGLEESCDGKDNDCDGLIDNQDADGDGHSLCDGSGDCDDNDPDVYPVVISAGAELEGANGSPAHPFPSLSSALASGAEGSEDCPIILLEGSYLESLTIPASLAPFVQGEGVAQVLITSSGEGPAIVIEEGGVLTLTAMTLSQGGNKTDGGLIVIEGGSLYLDDVALTNNTSGGDGGVVSVENGYFHMNNCLIENNVSADDGGAISGIGGTIVAEDSTFIGNVGKRGGAFFLTSSDLELNGCTFDSNTADTEGGALWIGGGGTMRITNSRFWSNTADGNGGALLVSDFLDSGSRIQGNLFQDNLAEGNGGGIAIQGSSTAFSLQNNTLTANTAGNGSGVGAGIYMGTGTGDLRIISNIMAWNIGASGLHREEAGGVTTYNSVFNTSGEQFGGALSVLEYPIDGTPPTVEESLIGNRHENPAFSNYLIEGDPADDDLRLRQDSPCRDSGPDDMAFLDTDLSQNDRGAYGGPSPIAQ